MKIIKKTVTIFGSSLPTPESTLYKDAFYIAKNLAIKGFNLCTGGYQGIMDAVSKAAFLEGKEAIGVTLKNRTWNKSTYLTTNIETTTLFERVEKLIEIGDAYIFLPGGTGTALELFSVLELMNKEFIPIKPAVAFGEDWKEIIQRMEVIMKTENRKIGLIKSVNNIKDLIIYLDNNFNSLL